jgi:predicted nucleotidyltransferase
MRAFHAVVARVLRAEGESWDRGSAGAVIGTKSAADAPDRAGADAQASRSSLGRSIVGLGCYGSYARGDWGVGSDLDVLVVVRSGASGTRGEGDLAVIRSNLADAMAEIPVPVDLFVLDERDWHEHRRRQTRFYRVLRQEACFVRDPDAGAE